MGNWMPALATIIEATIQLFSLNLSLFRPLEFHESFLRFLHRGKKYSSIQTARYSLVEIEIIICVIESHRMGEKTKVQSMKLERNSLKSRRSLKMPLGIVRKSIETVFNVYMKVFLFSPIIQWAAILHRRVEYSSTYGRFQCSINCYLLLIINIPTNFRWDRGPKNFQTIQKLSLFSQAWKHN